jgi:hypothetical protein
MKINRRQFVQSSLLAGAGLMIAPVKTFSLNRTSLYFGVHPFILQNPDAVFVMRTNVDTKTNSAVIKGVGQDFGSSVFVLTDDAENGIPLTHKVVIKPNLTCLNLGGNSFENAMGIITDVHFVEGIIESLKGLGITSGQFYIREVNCANDLQAGGYIDMASRTGIDLQGIETPASELNPDQIQWMDVPDGVWFKKIPYLWPVNAPDTFLLNISKFKAHGMGMTLCAKNLQGTIAMNYQAHCTAFGDEMSGVDPDHLSPTANTDIYNNYLRHRTAGIPRWDRPGSTGGIWQETWATRCLDNNSVTFAGLHIIEGIYGRDGNWYDGPNGTATDYMTNYIIFGRNQFHVDNIGIYLSGHEPGNFGLLHMARERGFTSTINPAEIPVYSWDAETGATQAELASFQRYPLKTYYLQRDYLGQSESKYHLVDEAYNYGPTGINDLPGKENDFFIHQNYPNPVQNTTSIDFSVPRNGHVTIEVINDKGQVMDVLVNKKLNNGSHTITWSGSNYPSGLYICRMRFEGSVTTQKLMVLH